ncbi:MAG: class I SAM-dependent methyltransferase [Candidatus Omnitrophica bacterium]|nr:class I SAM-dependent methyltransferase [Candidatus Omnitrophota bacterium]
MISFLKPWVRNKAQKKLASLPDDRGIKMLLRLEARLSSLTLGTIKLAERSRGGIHPKHWITDFVGFFLDNINASDTVLEIGCAYGHVASRIAEKAKHVTAIDIRRDAIEKAGQQFNRSNISFISADFFDFTDGSKFDVVVMSNVLEHIADRGRFLEKAAVLGGKLLIRVPAFDRDWTVPYKKKLGLEWRLNDGHEVEYTEGMLRDELGRAGLSVKYLCCKWGNYCCIAEKKRGDNGRS